MDDKLSAGRARRSALAARRGFMQGKRWAWAALVLLVCALTVTAIAVWGGRQSGDNAGVAALYDFYREYAKNKDVQTQGPLAGLAQRLLTEPFEISVSATLASEDLKNVGVPIDSVPAALKIKYDKQHLGMQADALGFDILDAYLIEDSAVVETIGQTPQVAAAIPKRDGLDGEMTLEERLRAWLPFLPRDGLGFERLFNVLKSAVPQRCTTEQPGSAFSPKDNGFVNVTEVRTELDAKALSETAAAFSRHMDDGLRAETQALVDGLAASFGLEAADVETLLERLENQDFGDTALSWSVYRRDGHLIGAALTVLTGENRYVMTSMAEFEGQTSCEYAHLQANDADIFTADCRITMQGETGTISAVVRLADGNPISVDGTFDHNAYTRDACAVAADLKVSGVPINGRQVSACCRLDARIDVGEGLGSLKDSRGWQDIFNKPWDDMR